MGGSGTGRIIILGGGAMGCALAYRLAHDHRREVTLLDPGPLAGGASGKAAGIVSTQCWNQWDVEIVEESRREYEALSREDPAVTYQEVGGVRTASAPPEVEALERQLVRLREAQIEAHLLGAADLQGLYPEAKFGGVLGALHTPRDAVILPTDLTLAFARRASAAGADLRSEEGTVHVRGVPGGWEVHGNSGRVQAEGLVVACGAWSKRVLASLGISLPLAPYLTRACLLKARAPPRFPWLHDGALDVYCRPFPGGEILFGDGTELVEVDPARPPATSEIPFLENISKFLSTRFPRWADSPVSSHWHGIVTSTPDRHPFIGPVPGATNLWVATGFNGYGIMRAGAAARRMADAMGTGSWTELAPCDPARFPADHPPFPPRPGFTLD
jgi:sarcosine oxidase, subunit beta